MAAVAAIIPALNEQNTLGSILGVLVACGIHEIVVVNDGSTDRTSEIAHAFPVKVIDALENRGKGAALIAGVQATSAPVLLFLDADLVGLTLGHVRDLIASVVRGGASMSLGIIDRGNMITRATLWMRHHKLPWPMLTGQRALLRSWYEAVPTNHMAQYGVEVALNEYCRVHKLQVTLVPLPHLQHVLKEKKMGLVAGFQARIRMLVNVFASFVRIKLH